MEDATPPAGSSLDRNLLEAAIDLDLMDEMLSGNYWLEATDYSDVRQPGTSNSTSPFGSSVFSPFFEPGNASPNQILPESDGQDEAQAENFERMLPLDPNLLQLGDFEVVTRSVDAGSSGWITPRSSTSSMKERLNHALMVIRESLRDSDVLVQIWVPVRMSGRRVLTTVGQPFWLNPSCQRLANYRSVSMKYQFSAEANSTEALGLPGRVFLGRVPEWTPDVRYFSSTEYPRVGHAQHFDVRGTLGLPIFERDSCSCLGVVELVRTIQKINYSADLENICNALQVVDLRSSGVRGVPCVKMRNDSYLGALPEILEVLRTVCETHKLPLAQTWIPCIQQCKGGSRHSDENYKDCVSTVDSACYVKDPSMFSFHEACSEYHLLRGQGVAGKAFTTNQPCFSPDITSFSKIEYPLSHHARVFNLRAAVAIRLRSINTGNADFVLEFFLPINCIRDEEQKLLLNSLSNTIQHICRSLRVVTGKELEEEAMSLDNQLIPTDVLLDKSFVEDIQGPNSDNIPSVRPFQVGASEEASSWISNVIETQQKEGSSALLSCDSLELNKPEIEEFSVTTHWGQQEVGLPVGKIFSEVKQQHHDYIEGTSDCRDSFTGDPGFLNTGKATEKRRTKTEKTVSLQVLRQYFAGSLKDAAKSLGVCPTTLKRICRQHGITRWPSRKIKKVGHSLKKLQVVIDSVHGAEGTFQFSSLYENFTKASGSGNLFSGSSTLSTLKQEEQLDTSKMQQQHEARISFHTSASNSLSSCSQTSSSSQCCSSGAKQGTQGAQLIVKQEVQPEENRTGTLKRAHSEVNIILSTQEAPISLTRSQSLEIVGEHHVSSSLSPPHKSRSGLLRIKTTYGEEKVRFRLQPTWTFQDLRQEIGKRFNIGNISSMDLKYLDDDSEWVLMTCDADLQECIDVCKSSGAQTVKITVHPASQRSSGNTLGHSGLS